MAKNLRLGYNFIRLSLVGGVVTSIAGVYSVYHVLSLPAGNLASHSYAWVAFASLAIDSVLFATVLWLYATRKLAQRVKILAGALDRGAEGNLTSRLEVTSEDEFGRLNRNFNVMMERLAGVVGRVIQSIAELRQIAADINDVAKQGLTAAEHQSEGVNVVSEAVLDINRSVNQVAKWVDVLSGSASENASSIMQMSSSIEEVNQHVEALADAVDEVSSSIFEMTAAEKEIGASANSLMNESTTTSSLVAELDISIKQVGEHALQTAAISETVRQDAENGREAVEATISGIGEIRRSSLYTVEAMENLSVRAADIGKILSVIDAVAEQTNLLALNASIIAAQAGEHGKGFAVVAEEIKELARRTSNSTKEISAITNGVQQETQRVVSAIKLSEQRIAEGELLSQSSGEALHKIVASAQQATTQVSEIARATDAQANVSRNMRMAMERVADTVRQIAKATQEQGRGGVQINAAVERMKNHTAQVRISTQGQKASSNLIVHATKDITAMIGNVRTAYEEEAVSSRTIVQAMESIQHSSNSNVEATRIMDKAVAGLAQQVKLLQKDMAGFSV
jgi:methyl-accepting chemotaxis protein